MAESVIKVGKVLLKNNIVSMSVHEDNNSFYIRFYKSDGKYYQLYISSTYIETDYRNADNTNIWSKTYN